MKLSEYEEILKKHALNNKEIEKNVKDGLLAEDIFEIVTKYDGEYYIPQYYTNKEYLNSKGILEHFEKGNFKSSNIFAQHFL